MSTWGQTPYVRGQTPVARSGAAGARVPAPLAPWRRRHSPWRAVLTFAITSGADRAVVRRACADERAVARHDAVRCRCSCSPAARSFSRSRRSRPEARRSRRSSAASCSTRATCPTGSPIAPHLRGPLWKRALSSQIVLDESTALSLAQPTPELGRLAFYACGCTLFVCWNLGTLTGALAGGAIGDPADARTGRRLPGEHARPARTAAAPSRRARGGARGWRDRARATPYSAPGVPILLAAAGALVAHFLRRDAA